MGRRILSCKSQPVIYAGGNETIDLEQSSGGCMHVLMVEKTGDGCIFGGWRRERKEGEKIMNGGGCLEDRWRGRPWNETKKWMVRIDRENQSVSKCICWDNKLICNICVLGNLNDSIQI
jgi:hypothetical protein